MHKRFCFGWGPNFYHCGCETAFSGLNETDGASLKITKTLTPISDANSKDATYCTVATERRIRNWNRMGKEVPKEFPAPEVPKMCADGQSSKVGLKRVVPCAQEELGCPSGGRTGLLGRVKSRPSGRTLGTPPKHPLAHRLPRRSPYNSLCPGSPADHEKKAQNSAGGTLGVSVQQELGISAWKDIRFCF